MSLQLPISTFNYEHWEPGYTDIKYIKIANEGNLAFRYALEIVPDGAVTILADVIDVYLTENPTSNLTGREALVGKTPVATLKEVISGTSTGSGTLLPEGKTEGNTPSGEIVLAIAMKMREDAGNEYQNLSLSANAGDQPITFAVRLMATQYTFEADSFDDSYDTDAEWPGMGLPGGDVNVSTGVTVQDGTISTEATMTNGDVTATIPAGVQVNEGVSQLTLTVSEKANSDSNVTTGTNEELVALDVHIDGVSANNTMPIVVNLGKVLPVGLNMGNLSLYHVEGENTKRMTQMDSVSKLNAHNQFYYDPATGNLTVAMATFSEVAVVADTENAWNGTVKTDWYNTTDTSFIIANADQLAGFGQIVGGMADGIEQDNFAIEDENGVVTRKIVKLIADVNLGDKESENDPDLIFHPIGYYYNENYTFEDGTIGKYSTVKSFKGIFDGNGHTISNFYQNTWEIKGDYDSNYYKDGMGLFGYVNGGAVTNLSVDNFSSDGEFTPTGVIAAYATDALFENIAITNCNPRVYNTGNGGIVGIGGNSSDANDKKLTFTNITIDNTNKISALWGSWDVACGGLMGMFRGYSKVTFNNCHVAAQIDVYNDVCGNYQYYWYRYAGMMIGSLRGRNTTDDNGYTVPDTTGITAENCTVHFGDWNDYYYCELVNNTIASYTHDYQFSRLTQVDSVDTVNMTVTLDEEITAIPTSGRYNYVVVNGDPSTENATCYHFVNGTVWNHEDAGYEEFDLDGNGELDDYKEDRQHYYLPFNQLFQGDGWGVKTIPIYDDGKTYFDGITILDREEANSVEKFEKADSVQDSYKTGTVVTIGELFKAANIEDSQLTIKHQSVQVTVSPAYGTDSTAGGTYTANTTDWTQGTLTFSGLGAATITITDYYFCTPTTITITVAEPDSVDKFEITFENTAKYLYRVGNANTVALGSLFAAKDGVEIGNVNVEVEALNGASVSGTYTASTSSWTAGTIQFNGTGPVRVTIDDDAYANEKMLYLEVVNAENVTAYSGLGNSNSVLLNDITMSSGGSYYLSGATLYGNGFTFDMTDGTYAAGGNTSSSYVFGLNNANLDNVKIVGAVYTKYGATVQSEYNRAAILSSGNNTITNCYISNCASAVRVKDGNLEIINSTIKGGNFANIDIRGGHVVLDKVTTINQVKGNDTAEDGTIVVGLGVVIYYENVLDTTTVEIKNGITQYNHLSKTQADTYITDKTAKNLTDVMFNSEYDTVQHNDGTDTWVNAGILSMTETVGDANISDVDGYVDALPSMTGVTGYLHTTKPDATSIGATAPEYTTAGQGAIAPSYSFDYTTKNYVAKTDGSNDYCYEQGGTVYISMDAGDTINWDTSILTAMKNGQTLSYTVSMNGTDYTGKSIAFSESGAYEVVYTYTDGNNYGVYAEGNIATYEKTYTKTVHISVAVIKASAKNAEFTMGSSNAATERITIDNVTYVSATGVTADNSTWTYITINGQKIYYPIVAAKLTSTNGSSTYAYFPVFENVVTITDYAENGTGDAFTYESSTTTLPSTLTAVKGIYKAASDVPYWYNLTNSQLTQSGASKIFKWASSSDAPSDPTPYNNVLCYKSPQVSADRVPYITLVQYSYTDATNTTYYYYVGYTLEKFTKQTTCVTPDTLITIADGTQVRVDSLNGNEELLVWNHQTGKLDKAPVAYIVDHDGVVSEREVIHLNFSNGKTVKVISEHVFFDATLNKYVALDNTAQGYIGHEFLGVSDDGNSVEKVELVSVEKNIYKTATYEVVSYKHLTCFTNDMLSTSAFLDQLLNVFDVDTETFAYNQEDVVRDIETYGLYTYTDFEDLISEETFELYDAQYLKIAISKGYITWEDIYALIGIYFDVEVQPIK